MTFVELRPKLPPTDITVEVIHNIQRNLMEFQFKRFDLFDPVGEGSFQGRDHIVVFPSVAPDALHRQYDTQTISGVSFDQRIDQRLKASLSLLDMLHIPSDIARNIPNDQEQELDVLDQIAQVGGIPAAFVAFEDVLKENGRIHLWVADGWHPTQALGIMKAQLLNPNHPPTNLYQ